MRVPAGFSITHCSPLSSTSDCGRPSRQRGIMPVFYPLEGQLFGAMFDCQPVTTLLVEDSQKIGDSCQSCATFPVHALTSDRD